MSLIEALFYLLLLGITVANVILWLQFVSKSHPHGQSEGNENDIAA
jgi:hypothetical protein